MPWRPIGAAACLAPPPHRVAAPRRCCARPNAGYPPPRRVLRRQDDEQTEQGADRVQHVVGCVDVEHVDALHVHREQPVHEGRAVTDQQDHAVEASAPCGRPEDDASEPDDQVDDVVQRVHGEAEQRLGVVVLGEPVEAGDRETDDADAEVGDTDDEREPLVGGSDLGRGTIGWDGVHEGFLSQSRRPGRRWRSRPAEARTSGTGCPEGHESGSRRCSTWGGPMVSRSCRPCTAVPCGQPSGPGDAV